MALHLPPALSVSRFVGGYKAVSDYTDLEDTETNDSQNVLYGPNGNLDSRKGSQRLLNVRLANGASPTVGEPITGHYYFVKASQETHVVAAGDSVYSYSSATAVAITSSVTDNSNTFFTFAQIVDPRSASDEVVLFTNGVDVIKMWNGSATAVNLSSVASSTGVPIAKYITALKGRIYAANITDAADVNAKQKVTISEISTTGAPAPHRFTDSFYVGQNNRIGEIQNLSVLNDQLIIYTRKSVWKFNPGSGNILDTSSLIELQESHGLFAPFSLVNVGDYHMFLSERGIFAFDGVNFVHLSEKVDEELLEDSNITQLRFAKAVFNRKDNQYILYYPGSGSNRNNRALIYDLRIKAWQPPVSGRQVSVISTFDDADDFERVIYGDYLGYLYQDQVGLNDGLASGFNGTVSSGTLTTLTEASASFPTAGDGLSGQMVSIYEGFGIGQERLIESNTSNTLTVSTWSQIPDSTSKFTVGGIKSYWRSKDFDFGGHDLAKLFRYLRLRLANTGNFDLLVTYIVDFKDISRATQKRVSLLEAGWIWGQAIWGQTKWGASSLGFTRKLDLVGTATQSVIGNHFAIRFDKMKANENFSVSGFDIELKQVGKR